MPTPVKPKRATKSEKVTAVSFAVPSTTSHEALVKAAENLHDILDSSPSELVMIVRPSAKLTWLQFVASRGRRYELEPWVGSLHADLGELVVAARDDRNRICLFEHYAPEKFRTLGLLSHRYLLGAHTGTITADYPQKPFGNDALFALRKTKVAELTAEQRTARDDYHDAIRVGLTQIYGADEPDGSRYADREGFWIVGGEGRANAAATAKLVGRVDYQPTSEIWSAAKVVSNFFRSD